jgi:hypothetical protein
MGVTPETQAKINRVLSRSENNHDLYRLTDAQLMELY